MSKMDWPVTLAEAGCLKTGHLIVHSSLPRRHRWCVQEYLDKWELLVRPGILATMADEIVTRAATLGLVTDPPPLVIGVPHGGVLLASHIGAALSRRLPNGGAYCLTTELTVDGRLKLDPHQEQYLIKSSRALVVVDVLARGVKVQQVLELLAPAEVSVAGILCLAQRSQRREIAVRELPVASILSFGPAYPGNECPRCAGGDEPSEVAGEEWFV